MELDGDSQWLLEVMACVALAYCPCQATLFFLYLLLLLPLTFLFQEPVGG